MNNGKVETICGHCRCMDWLHSMETTTCKKCKREYNKGTTEFTYVENDEVKLDLKGFRIYSPNALG